MIATLPDRCWRLQHADGRPYDRGDGGGEPHFDTEADAAECARDLTDVGDAGLVAVQDDKPCFTATCNGCGETIGSDEFSTVHYPDADMAATEAKNFDYFIDGQGNAWCDDCKVLKPHGHVPDPDGGEPCARCGVDVDEHDEQPAEVSA